MGGSEIPGLPSSLDQLCLSGICPVTLRTEDLDRKGILGTTISIFCGGVLAVWCSVSLRSWQRAATSMSES